MMMRENSGKTTEPIVFITIFIFFPILKYHKAFINFLII